MRRDDERTMARRWLWAKHATKGCLACAGHGEVWVREHMAFALCACVPDEVAARVQRETARRFASQQIKRARHSGGLPAAETNSGEPPAFTRSRA